MPLDALPLPASSLIYRETELSFIHQQLLDTTRLLTITGPGGVGKTHLALRAAHDLQDRFERCLFVDVSGIEPAQLVNVLLHSLGVPPPRQHALVQLSYLLAQQKTLLLLDNFETILEAAPLLSDLLAASSELHLLVTSRSRLGLRWESCLPLDPLKTSSLEESAAQFFLAKARAVQPDFTGHEDDIVLLCQRLDGLPLALELAAACLPAMTPRALLEHLEHHATLPGVATRDHPERQQNIDRVVNSSLSLLSEAEQLFFCRLSIFAGSFSVEAAAHITDAATLGLETLTTLLKLRDFSLIVSESSGTPRFKLLETLRTVAREKLQADLDATQARQLLFYKTFAEENEPLLSTGQQLATLTVFALESPNIAAVLKWAVSQPQDTKTLAVQLVIHMNAFWTTQNSFLEARTWLESFGDEFTATLRMKWLYARTGNLYSLGELSEALQLGKEALHLSYALSDKTGSAKALNLLGLIYYSQDKLAKALESHQASERLAKELHDPRLIMYALNNQGNVYKRQGLFDKARQCYEAALTSSRHTGDVHFQALSLNNLALLFRQDRKKQIELLEQSLVLLRQVGAKRDIAKILNNIAASWQDLREYGRGWMLAQESLVLAREAGDLSMLAIVLSTLGSLAEKLESDKAEGYYAESIELNQRLGQRWYEADVINMSGWLYHNNPPRAAARHLRALEIALEVEGWEIVAMCLDALADLEVKTNQPAQAALLWGAATKLEGSYTLGSIVTTEALDELRTELDVTTFNKMFQQGERSDLGNLLTDLNKRWGVEKKQKRLGVLSERQLEVLKLVAQGYSNKKMAKQLGVSDSTVKYHLKAVFDYLGVHSRAEAVSQASQRKLL
jgi:non-specific serine/threonine protein kinase